MEETTKMHEELSEIEKIQLEVIERITRIINTEETITVDKVICINAKINLDYKIKDIIQNKGFNTSKETYKHILITCGKLNFEIEELIEQMKIIRKTKEKIEKIMLNISKIDLKSEIEKIKTKKIE
jgi:hypothetical protein